MAELWKPVAETPDYAVSSHGRVRRVLPDRMGRMGPEFLATPLNDKGYPHLNLHYGGKQRLRRVHALVCEAFHGPRPKGLQCRHLDGDSTNNRADNLRWGTHAENEADRKRHGRARGYAKRLALWDVAAIRRSILKRRELAEFYDVSPKTITAIRHCHSWRHV